MSVDAWPEEWNRGVLNYLVTTALSQGPRHGYSLIETLDRAGVGKYKGGTIYPLLQRLEEQGVVSFQWEHPRSGPARKVFELTERGRARQKELERSWRQFASTVSRLGEE